MHYYRRCKPNPAKHRPKDVVLYVWVDDTFVRHHKKLVQVHYFMEIVTRHQPACLKPRSNCNVCPNGILDIFGHLSPTSMSLEEFRGSNESAKLRCETLPFAVSRCFNIGARCARLPLLCLLLHVVETGYIPMIFLWACDMSASAWAKLQT